MTRRRIAVLLAAALVLVLCGCSMGAMENLYALPELPEEFAELQAMIDEIRTPGRTYAGGAESISPVSGINSQTVQQRDLDGDGVSEAIAFFRATGEERPLKIYIFRQANKGYEVAAVIDGDGAAIESVSYENLNEGPAQELVVSWQLSANVHKLAVYSIQGFRVNGLMETGYTRMLLQDIDRDNTKEVLTVQINTVSGESQVECWHAQGEGISLVAAAPLSSGVTAVASSPVSGMLRGETPIPALFLTSSFGEGCVTDVFAWQDGTLANITLDPALGYSAATVRRDAAASPRDINGDGAVDVPIPMAFGADYGEEAGEIFLNWISIDIRGRTKSAAITYQNEKDRDAWYFVLPDRWSGKLVTSVRDNVSSTERTVTFSVWNGGAEETPETFLTISKLTGANRKTRAQLGERFFLQETGSAVYTGELHECSWDCGLDSEDVAERFRLVTRSWSSEN